MLLDRNKLSFILCNFEARPKTSRAEGCESNWGVTRRTSALTSFEDLNIEWHNSHLDWYEDKDLHSKMRPNHIRKA